MKDANSTSDPDVAQTTPLTHLLTDNAAQGLWCQLLDVSDALRTYFQSNFKPGDAETLLTQSSEIRQQNASLLSTYLVWLKVYYGTHHDEIVSDSDAKTHTLNQRINELGRRLVQDGLNPVGPCLWSFLFSYFRRLECIPKKAMEICLASLDFLSGLVPGQPIIPYMYFSDFGSVSLGHVLSDWLWSAWTDLVDSGHLAEAVLYVLVVTNNAWLSGVTNPWESVIHSDLIRWLGDRESFPNRIIKTGFFASQFSHSEIRLDLNVEVTILCIFTVTCYSHSAISVDRSWTRLKEDERNVDKVLKTTRRLMHKLRRSIESSESNRPDLEALEKRLCAGIQQCAEIQPIFDQFRHPLLDCAD
ncbi:hypothetical protein D915_009012 [Fasciola hepatica]|uniref:Uncharacterized protein n=1 Tax=Fasciola hepatica TaxID=6192 RepID=A0A4E0RG84_FASHE|nr:hypothetical protein D915_009012 [Fasciola hepatica]